MIRSAPALLLAFASAAHATMAPIDLERYAGTWHEIARVPNFFQRKCASDVTASYTPEADHVVVVNRCSRSDGKVLSVEGKAYVTDPPTNSRLKVGFFSIFGWMPFKGDYWILEIDPDYRWAIVGGPTTKYGWILARTPTLDAATRAMVDAKLRRLGYDVDAFRPGPVPRQAGESRSLAMPPAIE